MTLANYIKGTEGFRYFATQTLPQCNTGHVKKWRLKWSIQWHIFWEGAKMVASKVQIVYFHIDEKWFYSLVVRKNNKCVPEFGVQGCWNRIHHKNAVDKVLAICAMAFVPTNNNIRQGGTAVKLTITRSGGMKIAGRNTYKRSYDEDGSYTYPALPENILRVKGEEYFENWEITGSKDTDKGNAKFALTKWVKDTFMNDLSEYCQQLEQKLGKKIKVRGQWDNASPHTEKGLVKLIAKLFDDKGWVWTRQPSNSPLTNILDAAIFPALAKVVTSYQGLLNGSRYLKSEMLWKMVIKAWEEYPLDKIARAFVHHSQVAAAIYNCNGGDGFVQERNGISFGVRKVCRLLYDEGDDGAPALDLSNIEPVDGRVPQGVIVEEVIEGVNVDDQLKKLKYDVPNMDEYDIAEFLSHEELDLIAGDFDDCDYDNLSDAAKERYGAFVEAGTRVWSGQIVQAIQPPTDTDDAVLGLDDDAIDLEVGIGGEDGTA